MSDKFIINVCLTGSIPTKSMNPHVPVTPREIADDVRRCLDLGASIFHIHARDSAGKPDWLSDTYQRIMSAVREVSAEAVVCVSMTSRTAGAFEQRTAALETDPRPDMASLTMGSVNFVNDGMFNDPHTIRRLASLLASRGMKPEVEIFDIGMARTAARLCEEGVLPNPSYANLLLGNAATADVNLLDLAALLQYLPKKIVRCIGGIGRTQVAANTLGILYADGVRVGLEDNLYLDDRKTPATNPQLVKRVVELGALFGKEPTTVAETRALLGL
jgi:3-keto-5-aminohexanoate cleavage enzyme